MRSAATRSLWRGVAVGIPVAAAGLAWWDPARHGGPALCPWRALTGRACPGCGMTRALGALVHGRVHEAVDLHPLVLVVALQAAVLWGVAVVAGWGPEARRRPPTWVMPALFAFEGLLFLGVWGARWAGGTLPTA